MLFSNHLRKWRQESISNQDAPEVLQLYWIFDTIQVKVTVVTNADFYPKDMYTFCSKIVEASRSTNIKEHHKLNYSVNVHYHTT